MRGRSRPNGGSLRTVRDISLLLFVAAALVAGLIHFSLVRGADSQAATPAVAASSGPSSSSSSGPSSTTARVDASQTAHSAWTPSSSSSAPWSPSPDLWAPNPSAATTTNPAADTSATCWDGTMKAQLRDCSRPIGLAGLRWVFPSLDETAIPCRTATTSAGRYATVIGLQCTAEVDGQPVQITYEQAQSQAAASHALEVAFAGSKRYAIAGARGGRSTYFDADSTPARASGCYQGYPYLVSVSATDRDVVKHAWASLIRFRSSATIKGTPG